MANPMAFQTRIEQGHVVIQTTHNQLVLTSVDSPNESRVVLLSGSVETFCLSREADLVGVLLVDKHWHFYRLSSGTKFECRNKIEPTPFQLVLLHQESLWLGQVQANQLSFNVHHLSENMHYECSVELPSEFGVLNLTEFMFEPDQLVCALVSEHGSVLERFKLSSRQIESLGSLKLEGRQITGLECSPGNKYVIFVTNDNVVHLHDNDSVATWQVKPLLSIKTICFDSRLEHMLCVATESVLFFLYYIDSEQQLVVLETLSHKTNHSVIASQAPAIFLLSGSTVSTQHCKQLAYLKTNQKTVENMFALDQKQFVKQLHNCDFVDTALWSAMAKRCLALDDIDSAVYCAAKMNDPASIRSIHHEVATRGQNAARALLALNLGLGEEAEKILAEDKSALSKAYQLQNKWNESFMCADKIQIKSAYYNYARHLEEESKITEAIKFYEMSGNVLEVPRMLFETGNLSQLEEYCLKMHKNDKTHANLVTWWGQYCESQGDHKTAIEMYQSVADYYNLVRLMCHVGQTDKAIQIVNQHMERTGDKVAPGDSAMTTAMLYLGKHLEALNSTESIHYYLHCGAVRHAIRACIANELFDELVIIAVDHCGSKEANHILHTYCIPNQALVRVEPVVKLYYKCGLAKEAIFLAIDNNLWNQLRDICESELARETRDFVIPDQVLQLALRALKSDTSIIDIVIDLIIMSNENNFGLITQTIQDYGINVDDQLMDKLERYTGNQKNVALIDTFAELCLEKGNYQLAAKLYNKIGKRIDSLKALIRSGNVEKVVQFANVARDKTVFKMAANFLQTVNYEDTALIIKFYTRAEAYQELDRFKSELESI